jgi:hypothetical protein
MPPKKQNLGPKTRRARKTAEKRKECPEEADDHRRDERHRQREKAAGTSNFVGGFKVKEEDLEPDRSCNCGFAEGIKITLRSFLTGK